MSLSISADRPSITAIAGESGSGKTTLARLILGIIRPSAGQILYKGKPVTDMDRGEWKTFRREVQAIFQDPFEVYNPFYKVDHTLDLSVQKFGLAKSKHQRRELMEQALRMVGLRPEETLGRYPHQLSGGQRQRVMVARALLLKPKLIIADEPVSMVDASLRATILETLRALNREFGISLVYITHDLTTTYQVGENIIVLYRGSVAEVGDVELVVKQPRHPYTQLLVGSIPLPDPARAWRAEEVQRGIPGVGNPRACKFAGRCPHAMPMCVENPPPLFRMAEHCAASCYLYRDAPTLDAREMNDVFVHARVPA